MAAAVVRRTEATAIPPIIVDSVMVGRSYFSRVGPSRGTPKVFEDLEDQILQLSAKQVPSCTLLRKTGSGLLDKSKDALLKAGFTLEDPSGKSVYRPGPHSRKMSARTESSDSDRAEVLRHLLGGERRNKFGESVTQTPGIEVDDLEYRSNIPGPSSRGWKVRYQDPWKIMGYLAYKDFKGEELPEVLSWPGDVIRIQDSLPPRLFSEKWSKTHKNRIKFVDLADDEEKINFLKHRTFWGTALEMHCRGTDDVATWARALRYRIARFLKGFPDPSWNRKTLARLYEKPSEHKGNRRARALRFLEVLKTIDGAFTQRILAYPEEEWTWTKFDNFVLYMLDHLLSDEFLDGEVTTYAVEKKSYFSQLKAARKTFKLQSHTRVWNAEDYPAWLPWYPSYSEILSKSPDGHRYAFLIGMLSQTRGCGTPPPIVLLQSKIKFLETVTVKPDPLTWEEGLIRWAAEAAIADVPGEAFTGLDTKGKVVISTSACWEKTRRDGGTIEAIMEIVESYFDHIPFFDWDTGKVLEVRPASEFENIGQVALHACYSEVIRTDLNELRRAYLTIVKEPGKGRVVTKANAALKIVLDFVNKICAEPLRKGFASSTSGMGKSNHGWNAFISDFQSERADTLFNLYDREVEELSKEDYVRDEFSDCFALSTDYSEATDFMHHRVGEILGRYWMRACGIPAPLQGLCVAVCFQPREIYFSASGPLAAYGESATDFGTNIRKVLLQRGILMGDPLTKIVLHLTNICVRKIAERISDLSGLDRVIKNPGELGDALSKGCL